MKKKHKNRQEIKHADALEVWNEVDCGAGNTTNNSRKSVRWSAVPVPCLSRLRFKLRGEQGSGPEGVDDLCFHTYG